MAIYGTLAVNNSTISGNTVEGSGGGIQASSCTLAVDHSVISDTSAWFGCGIHDNFDCALMVGQSMISDNSAVVGGGLYAGFSTAQFDHSTLNDPIGGGIFNFNSTIHLNKSYVDTVPYDNQDYP